MLIKPQPPSVAVAEVQSNYMLPTGYHQWHVKNTSFWAVFFICYCKCKFKGHQLLLWHKPDTFAHWLIQIFPLSLQISPPPSQSQLCSRLGPTWGYGSRRETLPGFANPDDSLSGSSCLYFYTNHLWLILLESVLINKRVKRKSYSFDSELNIQSLGLPSR